MGYTPAQISRSKRDSHTRLRDSQFNLMNSQSLKDMLNYITSLKNNQIIDDEVFSELILYSCAIFVENQIEKKISTSISNILFTTSHIMEKVNRGDDIE